MQQLSEYKFKARLHSYQGWGNSEIGEIDDVLARIKQESNDDEKFIVVDASDVESIVEIVKKDGRKKITLIELLTFNGGVITLCEERVDDVIGFWKSATELTEEPKSETKTDT